LYSRPQLYTFVLIFLVGFLLAFYLISINFLSCYPESSDFGKFYMSSKFLLEGKDIYTPIPLGGLQSRPKDLMKKLGLKRDNLHPNLNPPFQTLLITPLAWLDYRSGFWVWSLLSLTCGVGGTILVLHESIQQRIGPVMILGAASLILGYFPTWATIIYGQFSLYVLLLLAIAWIAARRGDDRIAGLTLGLAASLKIFTGLFIIFFAVRRRWRLLAWLLGAFVACYLTGLLVMGPAIYAHYRQVLSSVTWYSSSWNASFMGFFSRIFGGSENIPLWNLPLLGWALTGGISFVSLVMLLWQAWPRGGEDGPDRFDLGFSLTIPLMFLISPLGWMYYFPALLIPAAVAWRISNQAPIKRYYKPIIALAWVLSTVPHFFIPSAEANCPVVWFTWAGYYFYALLLFTGLLLWMSLRLTKAET
jgi:hypothetical protein